MKKKIILHGYLKELHPGPLEVEASTIAEAVQFLAQIPVLFRMPGHLHAIEIDGVNSEIALYAATSLAEIHVRPRMTGGGGGNSSMMQIVIGVTMIAVAVWNPAFLAMSAKVATTVGLMGANLAIGGVLQLLMPQPQAGGSEEGSKYLGGAINTTAIGTPITQIYGTRKVGGHYLSFDVDANVTKGEANETLFNEDATGTTVKAYPLIKDQPLTDQMIADMQQYLGGDDYDFFDSEQDALYVVYDYTPLTNRPAVVCPQYSSAVASPSNIPVSGWAAEGQV